MNIHILVTGASGFLGAQLTRRLSETDAQITALYNRNAPNAEMRSWPGVQWKQADLLDICAVDDLMQGIEEVYHCAALVTFNPARAKEITHTNTETTANVVNTALEAGVRKLVFISSVAALGRNINGKPISEETEWEESPLNSRYGISKQQAEMEVWRGVGEGLDAVVLNPGIILGIPLQDNGWKDGSGRLMQNAWDEFPFYTNGRTAFVDAEDVIAAAIGLMHSDVSAERFILSTGNIPYRDIFDHMADALNRKRPRFHAAPWVTGLIWRWFALQKMITGKSPLITKETAQHAQSSSVYQADKILKALPGFSYTPIETTIKRMAAAFLKQIPD